MTSTRSGSGAFIPGRSRCWTGGRCGCSRWHAQEHYLWASVALPQILPPLDKLTGCRLVAGCEIGHKPSLGAEEQVRYRAKPSVSAASAVKHDGRQMLTARNIWTHGGD